MTFETRKRLAEHFLKLGLKKHIYVLEMKKNKGDNPKTKEIEKPTTEIKKEIEKEEAKEEVETKIIGVDK